MDMGINKSKDMATATAAEGFWIDEPPGMKR
jgi:hypothetical protein